MDKTENIFKKNVNILLKEQKRSLILHQQTAFSCNEAIAQTALLYNIQN